MRKLLVIALVWVALLGCATAQQSFYTGWAVGLNPFAAGPGGGYGRQVSTPGLVPIQYGWVRVCTWPTTGSPCQTPAINLTDQYGNPIGIIGGNFGQLQTLVTGQFTFGCPIGDYVVQVAASSNNTPQIQYNISCPTTLSVPFLGTINQQGPGSPITGNGTVQQAYIYTLPAGSISSTGGIEAECTIDNTGAIANAQVAICFDGSTDCASGTSNDFEVAENSIVDERWTIYDNNAINAQWTKAVAFNTPTTAVYATPYALNMNTSHTIGCYVQQSSGSVTPEGFSVSRLAF